jgi:hypothetical protein
LGTSMRLRRIEIKRVPEPQKPLYYPQHRRNSPALLQPIRCTGCF